MSRGPRPGAGVRAGEGPAPAPTPGPGAGASLGAAGAGNGGSVFERSLQEATVMDRAGYPYIVHPLLDGVPRVDPALLREWSAWAAAQDALAGATVILAPEAMGLPLGAALSLATGLPYVVARKRPYGLAGERLATARTGYGEATLHVNDLGAGDAVAVVDDVMSTGRTLDALLGAVRATGARVVGVLVAVDKGTARQELSTRHRVRIRAWASVSVQGGQVRVRISDGPAG